MRPEEALLIQEAVDELQPGATVTAPRPLAIRAVAWIGLLVGFLGVVSAATCWAGARRPSARLDTAKRFMSVQEIPPAAPAAVPVPDPVAPAAVPVPDPVQPGLPPAEPPAAPAAVPVPEPVQPGLPLTAQDVAASAAAAANLAAAPAEEVQPVTPEPEAALPPPVALDLPVSEPFDCGAGFDNCRLGWSEEKKNWCYEHTPMACPEASEPFDCQAGLDNWKAGWSEEKQSWCCERKQIACEEELAPAAPSSTPSSAMVTTAAETTPAAPSSTPSSAMVTTAAETSRKPHSTTTEAPTDLRICVDLPGIQLKDTSPLGTADKAKTPAKCTSACRQNDDCKQAIFSSGNNGCYLFSEAGDGVADIGDMYNSSYCGAKAEEKSMMSMLRQAYAHVADFPPPIVECSFSGDDCSQTKCCNDVKCDLNFTECVGYKCYKQDEYFAGCLLDPPESDWDGTVLGGPRETREIEPAAEGAPVQGTSLFCFSVISWDAPPAKDFWSTEKEMADHIKEHSLSIFQCDASEYFDGGVTEIAKWGSFSNIDAFVDVWKAVKKDGRYNDYDWTVKVDSDAVFFPERLKEHLTALRTPKGARVYLKNIDYQFNFMGALEVISREGLETYFQKGDSCIRGKHDGGEDFFMSLCLDSIGVDHQTDFKLLRDKYCLSCTDVDHNHCDDGETVAYHFHKKIISWDWCYNQAVCGNANGQCDGGIEVEFVMPHVA